MVGFYPEIRLLHVASVIASGALFFLRGSTGLLGLRVGMTAPVRYLSYAIDTTLLTAAFMLATMLRQYPVAQDWLTAKVVLLVIYIVLGTFALKRGRSGAARAGFFVGALAVYLTIVSIAQTRQPLGWLHALGGA